MAKILYESNIRKLIATIDYCFKENDKLSGLILLYSVIDIMSWLSRDPHDAESTKSDFIRWIEEFLLPGSNLKCTAEELYQARFSIIHSYIPEWGTTMNVKSDGNKITYIWGKAGKNAKDENIKSTSRKPVTVVVNVDDFVNALKIAIQRFDNSLVDNRALFELIEDRSRKFFGDIVNKET